MDKFDACMYEIAAATVLVDLLEARLLHPSLPLPQKGNPKRKRKPKPVRRYDLLPKIEQQRPFNEQRCCAVLQSYPFLCQCSKERKPSDPLFCETHRAIYAKAGISKED